MKEPGVGQISSMYQLDLGSQINKLLVLSVYIKKVYNIS